MGFVKGPRKLLKTQMPLGLARLVFVHLLQQTLAVLTSLHRLKEVMISFLVCAARKDLGIQKHTSVHTHTHTLINQHDN